MANVINNLANNRDKIRKLMSMDTDGTMDRIANEARESNKLSIDESGVSYNSGISNTNGDMVPIAIDENVMKRHSKMPKSILESFKENPGKTAQSNVSVLSRLPNEMFQEQTQPVTQRKNTINESKQVQQPIATSAVIDYSLIKTIINESVQENVKKYISALSKKLINEGIGSGSANDLIAMKVGKSFSFIDKQGNVYECTLKKKGNVNNISE
jgi:hypothetical protein